MTPLTIEELRRLDETLPDDALMALTAAEGFSEPSTRTSPRALICDDGNVYWVKCSSVRGLESELIAGRLAALTGAGVISRPVRVTAPALASLRSASALREGVGVGSRDVPNSVNWRDVQEAVRDGFDPSTVDGGSRAKTVAFQTWIGVGDSQVLVRLNTGQIVSIDHEEAFRVEDDQTPQLIVAPLDGASDHCGRTESEVVAAIAMIQSVTDEHLLRAVARTPRANEWSWTPEDRLAVAVWLARRRDALEPVLRGWVV